MKEKIYIDFDGVILNTKKEINELKNQFSEISWEEFSQKINWDEILTKSSIISNSLNIIKKIQNIQKEICIITKTNSLEEQLAKIKYLRRNNIKIPVFFVPPHLWKSEVVIPRKNDILIDDNIENIVDWINSGGRGIWFCNEIDSENKFETISSLNFLL